MGAQETCIKIFIYANFCNNFISFYTWHLADEIDSQQTSKRKQWLDMNIGKQSKIRCERAHSSQGRLKIENV